VTVIRLICRESDVGAAANVCGPVNVTYKTFDLDLPEVEAWLRKTEMYIAREMVAAELLPIGDAHDPAR